MDRILTWFIDEPSTSGYATYFLNRDCTPTALRIHAGRAPDAGDLIVDVLVDGASIMASNPISKFTNSSAWGQIEYTTLATSTFTIGEQINGGTSSAYARVMKDNAIGSMSITRKVTGLNTTAYTVGETITGQSSGATAVVTAYIPESFSTTYSISNEGSKAVLLKGENAEPDAEDFSDSGTLLGAGSGITVNVTPNGAKQITIQLELEYMEDDSETEV